MKPPTNLGPLLIEMEQMKLNELRIVWRQHLGAPPPLRSTELLRHCLSWRLQAAVSGGLDLETRNALKVETTNRRSTLLSDGVRISREWKGRRHDVERGAEGFTYEGKTYRSLSEIAREITGVRWNGPRFFGLRTGNST